MDADEHGTYEVTRVWQPNVVPHQVQQVSYVPQTVAQQVPVQVCSYQPEQVHHQVPYQTCRIVQEECVRQVPYTVCKPVVERVERQRAGDRLPHGRRGLREQVPVQTCKMVYEERVDRVPYQVCRMAAYQETVSTPRCVEKRIPVTYTYSRAADGLLPRAGQRLRRDDRGAGGADASQSGDEAEVRPRRPSHSQMQSPPSMSGKARSTCWRTG